MTGLPCQGRIVPLLHGGVERVQVHVEDDGPDGVAHVFTSRLRTTRTRVVTRVVASRRPRSR